MPIDEMVSYIATCDRCDAILAEGDGMTDILNTLREIGAEAEHLGDGRVLCSNCLDADPELP